MLRAEERTGAAADVWGEEGRCWALRTTGKGRWSGIIGETAGQGSCALRVCVPVSDREVDVAVRALGFEIVMAPTGGYWRGGGET